MILNLMYFYKKYFPGSNKNCGGCVGVLRTPTQPKKITFLKKNFRFKNEISI